MSENSSGNSKNGSLVRINKMPAPLSHSLKLQYNLLDRLEVNMAENLFDYIISSG